METKNIEIEIAGRNIEKLRALPMMDTTIYAISNERSIIEVAKGIERRLDILARDYTVMAEMFRANGETLLYNINGELPEMKAQLKCRKEARNLYAELLK